MIPVYQFHIAFTLRKFSFLSIGKDHQYTEEEPEEQVESEIKLLEKVMKENKRMALVLSGTFIEYLEGHPKIVTAIQAGVKKNQIILLGSTYHGSLASLYSPGLFKEQIKMHQVLLKKVFDQQPDIFYNTATLYFDKLAGIYNELGIAIAIAPYSEWHLNGRNNTIFQGKDGLKLVLLAEDVSGIDSNRIGLLDEGAMKSLVAGSTGMYRVPQPIYNKKLVAGKTLSSNALQNAVHQKILYLKKRLKKQKRTELYNSLSLFTSLDFFDMLTKTDDQNNREPHEHYTNLMNVLTDFELVNKI